MLSTLMHFPRQCARRMLSLRGYAVRLFRSARLPAGLASVAVYTTRYSMARNAQYCHMQLHVYRQLTVQIAEVGRLV